MFVKRLWLYLNAFLILPSVAAERFLPDTPLLPQYPRNLKLSRLVPIACLFFLDPQQLDHQLLLSCLYLLVHQVQRVKQQLQSLYTFEFMLNSYIRKNITFEIRITGLIYWMLLGYHHRFTRGLKCNVS